MISALGSFFANSKSLVLSMGLAVPLEIERALAWDPVEVSDRLYVMGSGRYMKEINWAMLDRKQGLT